MIQGISYAALSPVLIVALAGLALLLADAFEVPRRVLGTGAVAALAAALVAVFALVPGRPHVTFCVPASLRGAGPLPCSYIVDNFTLTFQGIVLASALVVVLMSLDSLDDVPMGEYLFLVFCAVVGVLTLVAARDLILLVVALETLSLPVFALVALKRYDGRATEAAIKLFLVSVISTAILLFGISLVYGATGTMHVGLIGPVAADLKPVMAAGIVMIVAGFGFKVAAVPFHFWAPDVYQGAPLPVAAFLSVISKAGGFAGLAIVLALGFSSYGHVWGPLIAVLAAVTMTAGNLMALRQTHAIRLLAWSSVAQSGYMLAPLAVGSHHTTQAVAATVAYVAFYAIMNLGAFAVVTGFGPRVLVEDYRGLARVSPWHGAALAFFLLCLAGLPPGIMGLVAKIVVFEGVVTGGVTWLAVVMAINTVIGLYYYLAWAVRLFQPATGSVSLPQGLPFRSAVAVTAAGATVLSVEPQLLLQATLSLG
ncbi:MAG: NADH-quinone oxidoreductase subunit N [Streptosporangiaceae bacterium]